MTGRDPADASFGRLLRVFACAAADPRLSGVLLFDVPPALTAEVVGLFAAAVAEGGQVVHLGAAVREDDLWSRTRLRPARGRIALDVLPGDLVEADPAAPPRAVVVPDLARLPLPGLRAAVTVLGAEAASVERHGASATWRPRARWLAFCRTEDAGRVSPHLLDRFPLRLAVPGLRLPADRTAADRLPVDRTAADGPAADRLPADGLAADGPAADRLPADRLPADGPGADGPGADRLAADGPGADRLAADRTAAGRPAGGRYRRPPLDEEALARVAEQPGERRALALARIARALAGLADPAAPATTAAHVAEAARLIGLAPDRPPAPDADRPRPDHPEPLPPPEPPAAPPQPEGAEPGSAVHTTELPAPGPEEPLTPFADPAPARPEPGGPYPEDEAEPLREYAPLRAAWRRASGPAADRGPVTGIRRATDLRDLALVPTVIEAAKHQRLPGRVRDRGALAITAGDLRSHARAAEPERMLVLLLDHTSRPGPDWQQAIAPYVQWAYAARATVAVVEVGGAPTADELRAHTFHARNVLDPRLAEALERTPGRASPLAHGLLLAAQLVRRAFQQQPTALAEAWLVVASDGRGNIPLRTSLTGLHEGPVGRRGVQDALVAAGQFGAMGRMRLHTVVLDTGAQPYAELPFELADALGGSVVAGPATEGDEDAAG
ncbi:magnesium chelatase [Streptomyces sp. CA2R106]|uniref:magnesium chelatase n=1 Tax=Streptomyces sp. CA2R106 TaxID=3120153 RepID=UPI0030097CAA